MRPGELDPESAGKAVDAAETEKADAVHERLELAGGLLAAQQAKEDPRVPIDRLRRTATDPWKHRAVGMHCDTCMWYVAKHAPVSSEEIGRCRRHAPTMNGYPVVFPVDWCGDHKLDEMKV